LAESIKTKSGEIVRNLGNLSNKKMGSKTREFSQVSDSNLGKQVFKTKDDLNAEKTGIFGD
jgi:hypothetical protein